MTNAPWSTRSVNCETAGAPGRSTTISAAAAVWGWNPTEDKICGQGPGSSPSTAKPIAGEAELEGDTVPADSRAGRSRRARRDAPKGMRKDVRFLWSRLSLGRLPTRALVSEGIPESGADIEEVGFARAILGEGVRAAHHVYGEHQGRRHESPAKAHSGSGLDKVCPGLAFVVHGEICVHEELHSQAAEGLERARSEAGA